MRFRIIFPGSYEGLPHKLMIKDGRVNKKYEDICEEPVHYTSIAFNNDPPFFDLDETTGEFTEYPLNIKEGDFSKIPRDYEMMVTFIKFYNIIPHWINCNFTWGWFNEETQKWTGAVGQVSSFCEAKIFKKKMYGILKRTLCEGTKPNNK